MRQKSSTRIVARGATGLGALLTSNLLEAGVQPNRKDRNGPAVVVVTGVGDELVVPEFESPTVEAQFSHYRRIPAGGVAAHVQGSHAFRQEVQE